MKRTLLAAVVGVALIAPRGTAHEIPARVMVMAFVKPDGSTLRMVVRVPLEAMRDMAWPLRGPGYLDLAGAQPFLTEAARLWIVSYLTTYENGVALAEPEVVAARVSLPSDRSFGSWDAALAHVRGPPLASNTDLPWRQALLDVLLEYPISSEHSAFSLRPELAHLGLSTTTVLRFVTPQGAERVFQYVGNPGLVQLDPRWHQAALRFVVLGFQHILGGLDHLLFIVCLLAPFRRMRPLVVIVTAFTAAHSITLIAAAMGLTPDALWFPPLIEALIAVSIVFMALENIVGARLERRWVFAFAFGLVHGFGFSFFLRESLQFAGGHLATSLFAFNVGVELGQLMVVALAVPALNWLFRRHVKERVGIVIISALVAHSAWHWMIDRWSVLRQFRFRWPALDPAFAASVMRGLMLVLLLAGILGALYAVYGKVLAPREGESETTGEPEGGRTAAG